MNTNLKDTALIFGAAVASLGSIAILMGVPALWIAILAFLVVDLGTILYLGSGGRPRRRRCQHPKLNLSTA